jgi:predicted glycogen debranching enzyme
MDPMRFDRDQMLKQEWLETNGLGGFASSTICGANTRRYHGLLVAAVEPMVRFLLLSKLEETLVVGVERFELATNLYSGAVHPEGYRYLTGFRLDPFPIFTFEAGGVTVEKRLFLVDGENTVVVEYALLAGPGCRLEVRPLVAFRGYHELTHRNAVLDGALDEAEGQFSICPYAALPRLYFAHNADRMDRCGDWYLNVEYPVERERGLDFQEDLYCPCVLQFALSQGRDGVTIASTLVHRVDEAAALKRREVERRAALGERLHFAASQFIVRRGAHRTVIAGYPWFTDWGRDTMISIPGLTLATGRFDVARDILLEYAGHIEQGLLPNTFPDADGPPAYNSADAALWFFEAIRQYAKYSGDLKFVRAELYQRLDGIIEAYARGTRGGIGMDPDGLIAAGDANSQLTWMDARVEGMPVTPRHGKPVEIQALWYNAVRFMQALAWEFGDSHGRVFYESLALKAAASFNALFWNEKAGFLYDVVGADGSPDASMRPNQLIALSLGYCAIDAERARGILSAVERKLLTPYGLRTLPPDDPRYRGRCEGPPSQRDAAYHQGTVWPWLLGPFITAGMRFDPDATWRRVPELLKPLLDYAESRGCGQIPEIFDGDAPHEPRGCFAQAWSVAEILRVSL